MRKEKNGERGSQSTALNTHTHTQRLRNSFGWSKQSRKEGNGPCLIKAKGTASTIVKSCTRRASPVTVHDSKHGSPISRRRRTRERRLAHDTFFECVCFFLSSTREEALLRLRGRLSTRMVDTGSTMNNTTSPSRGNASTHRDRHRHTQSGLSTVKHTHTHTHSHTLVKTVPHHTRRGKKEKR